MGGVLWSSSLTSSLNDGSVDNARFLIFSHGCYVSENGNYRYYGQSVRGVQA
jgi:hypothetical protein